MVKLSKRLEAIASFVPFDCYLADVGSDHAYLPIYLIENDKIDRAQAIDNKMAPYLRMKRNVEEAGLSSKITCSNSDGLDQLSDYADCVAICGVGGLLTCQILDRGKDKLDNVKTLILDPHRDLTAVRKKLVSLGYRIVDETMVYEKKIYYSIMKWEKGSPAIPYSVSDLEFGPVLRKKRQPIFLEWLSVQFSKVNLLLDGALSKEQRKKYIDLYHRLKDELKKSE